MKIRLVLAFVGLGISFALPIFAQQTNTPDTDKVRFKFQDITNANDPTFNQELGINNAGVIAGYFGSGAAGHPNKGYTVVRPYNTQLDFTNENFPGSFQTQVIGINNRGGLGDRDHRIDKDRDEREIDEDRDERDFDRVFRGTTVGFWSNTNNASQVNNGWRTEKIDDDPNVYEWWYFDIHNHDGTIVTGILSPQTAMGRVPRFGTPRALSRIDVNRNNVQSNAIETFPIDQFTSATDSCITDG